MQVDGMNELLNRLTEMADAEQIKQRALDKGAEHIRQRIAQNTHRSNQNKEHAADNVVIQDLDDRRLVGYAPDFFYMMFVELGTSKVQARPVVAPTFEREIKNTQRIMAEEIRKGLGL